MWSGIASGALTSEAEHAETKKDFIHKMSIRLKEINGTKYWLCLLRVTGFIREEEFKSIYKDFMEILKIMAKIVKTSKENFRMSKK